MTYEIPVTKARAELADLINRVVYGDERVVVTRHGRPLVALVSAADLERLENREAEAAAVEEHSVDVVSAAWGVRSIGSAPGEPGGFGVTARHGEGGGAGLGGATPSM